MARFDALDGDPSTQPPYRQLTQAEEGTVAGKGHAVIGANRQRQAEVLKNPLGCEDGCKELFTIDASGT
jgi:hypothetical protein